MKAIQAAILAIVVSAIFFLPKMAYAVDVAMNSNGQLLFEPSDITINKGESIHFVNGMLPPHNIIVDGRPDLSRESLFFSPGQTQDIVFADAGDYDFYCGHHHAAGMIGKIHVK